jgi:hypothetical protein
MLPYNTIIMLISRKGGHAGGCLPLLSSHTRSQQAVLHRCARNKQCYTAVLLPKHYTTRKQIVLFICIVLYKSLAEVPCDNKGQTCLWRCERTRSQQAATPLCSQVVCYHYTTRKQMLSESLPTSLRPRTPWNHMHTPHTPHTHLTHFPSRYICVR